MAFLKKRNIVKSKFKIFEVKHFLEINNANSISLYKLPVYFLLD